MAKHPGEQSELHEKPQPQYGLAALTPEQTAMLAWTPEEQAQAVIAFNQGKAEFSETELRNKVIFFNNQVGTHEVFDLFRSLGDPHISQQKVLDIMLGDTEGKDTHFGRHELQTIFPPGYIEAVIESQRQDYLNFVEGLEKLQQND